MLRLNEPTHTFDTAITASSSGITGNPALHQRLLEGKSHLVALEKAYIEAGKAGELYSIQPINTALIADPKVVQDLTKSDLVKVYDQYFAAQDKPARNIYESLLNSAKEKCPFCGGIGTPRNLDHFLPKSHFPQYSILPRNLIPSCRDCNMDGKGQAFAKSSEEQIIHPYVDNDRFFQEQWIFARYNKLSRDDPGEFEYFVQAPNGWSEPDQQKIKRHFNDFSIARRYATKAAEAIGTVIEQIGAMEKKGIDAELIKSVLLIPGITSAPFANHWQTGLYQALIARGW